MAEKQTSHKKNTRIVLLDAHAIIHRAYHALPDFTSPQGEPTGALFGLCTMLLKIVDELSPDYLIACYDLPEKTFRHHAYEGYKAGRAKTDEALSVQLDRSRAVFQAFGIPICEQVGFEADDVLGTLAARFKKQKHYEIIIASGDMDTLQLVDGERVKVYTLRKGIQDTVLYDENAVIARFGFPPALLPDYKGLRGDPSDNIIGVAGIGEKTATELITQFGGVEQMYRVLKKKGGEKQFLEAGIKPRIIALLKEREEEALFSKELATIRTNIPLSILLLKETWSTALDVERVLTLFADLGFRTLSARFKSKYGADTPHTSASKEDVGQEESFDPSLLQEAAVALWLLRSDVTNPTINDIRAYAPGMTLADVHKKLLVDLAAQDLMHVFLTIEKPLIPIVARMEKHGVLLDLSIIAMLLEEYRNDLGVLQRNIFSLAGTEFNINSPKQLGDVLFDTLALGVGRGQKKTATGQRSTREAELEKLAHDHPIIPLILEYREVQKLISTYLDVMPGLVGEDGRLHAHFSQTGTTTGRMSSQHPNLQNIPIKTERGRRIRHAFVAPKGAVLLALDYSQIELRIAAFLSGDEKLIELFRQNTDIHRAVAAEMFNVPPEAVDSIMRNRAKVINFGILYGMGVNALRANLGVSRSEAQEYLAHYFQNFSGLARYLESTKYSAARLGYTTTYFGRKRFFEGIRSRIPQVKAAAERMAINAPIQGTQADIIKLAMIAIDGWIEREHLREHVSLVLQVHDELVFEVSHTHLKQAREAISNEMQSVLPLTDTHGIPLLVASKVGRSWGDMHT